MSNEGYDPAKVALAECAASGMPTPTDLLEELGPLGALLFLHDVVYEGMALWAAYASEAPPDDPEGTEPITRALQGIATAAGALDAACVAMAILPPEAVKAP